MLTLLTYAPAAGVRCPSPFGLKTETLLVMSGLPYKTKYTIPMKSPTGKLPVLIDGEKTIPDSSHIQRHLETVHGIDFDAHLTDRQIAIAEAFRRMVEEHLYFAVVHSRWIMNSAQTRDLFFKDAPWPVRHLVFPMLVRGIGKALRGQGIGRHAPEEIEAFGVGDLKAIETAMEGPFFFGDKPASLDATLYGSLENIASSPIENAMRAFCRDSGKINAFLEAMRVKVMDGRAA